MGRVGDLPGVTGPVVRGVHDGGGRARAENAVPAAPGQFKSYRSTGSSPRSTSRTGVAEQFAVPHVSTMHTMRRRERGSPRRSARHGSISTSRAVTAVAIVKKEVVLGHAYAIPAPARTPEQRGHRRPELKAGSSAIDGAVNPRYPWAPAQHAPGPSTRFTRRKVPVGQSTYARDPNTADA
jgi:hypothetical protein